MHTEYLETELLIIKSTFFQSRFFRISVFRSPKCTLNHPSQIRILFGLKQFMKGIKRFDILFLYLLFPKIVNLPWRKIHLKSEGQKTEQISGFLNFTCLGCVLSKKTNIFLVNINIRICFTQHILFQNNIFSLYLVFFTPFRD